MTSSGTGRSLAGNTFFAGITGGSALLGLALLIIAGRVLGDEQYGRFSFAFALATIFETFVDFGLKEIATRSVARERSLARTLASNMFGLKLVLSLATMAALIVTARVMSADADVRLACYLLGVSSVLRSYLLTSRHVLMGLERFDLDSAIVVTDRLLLLALGTAAVWLGYGVVGLAWSFVLARVLAVGLAYELSVSQVGAFGFGFDTAVWRDLQSRALPFAAFVVVLYLYSYIDTVMLGLMRGYEDTGQYSAAYRVYEGVSGLPAILQAVLTPRLARFFTEDGERHARLARAGLRISALVAAPVVVLAVAASGPLITVLWGIEYAAAIGVLRILAVGLLFVFPLFVLHAEAISTDAEHLLLRTALIGCAVNIGLNLGFIPWLGIYGAAIATVVGEGVSLGVLFAGLRRVRASQRASATMPEPR